MKIIQIIPAFRLAGAEIMCENLCVALKNAGETVIAVSLFSEQTAITERLRKNGVRIVFLEKKPGFDPSIFVKLVKLFRKEKPDVVHTHIYASKYALPAAVLAGVKRKIHTVHNMAQKEQGWAGRKINSFMYKYCNVTPVALSNEIRRSIQEVYGLPKNKIPAIYNGIDLSKCIPKETYGIKECYTFLHIGRFMKVKNHETLIRAFAKIAALHENVKLQLIGEGELRPQIEELVKSLKIENKVEFLGLQANVYPFLHGADTFCLPSKYEGIPMTLIEAMGTGVPIISSAVGGIPDMLRDERDALLVLPDMESVANSMERLYSDCALRERLGVAAEKRSKDFSSETMAIKYIDVYKMLECKE